MLTKLNNFIIDFNNNQFHKIFRYLLRLIIFLMVIIVVFYFISIVYYTNVESKIQIYEKIIDFFESSDYNKKTFFLKINFIFESIRGFLNSICSIIDLGSKTFSD